MVRAWKACRGLRAWRAPKQTHGTEEARRVPAALTTRAKQEGRRNDKKCRLALRESDRLIVSSGKAQAPKLEKGPTCWRSTHRQCPACVGDCLWSCENVPASSPTLHRTQSPAAGPPSASRDAARRGMGCAAGSAAAGQLASPACGVVFCLALWCGWKRGAS